MPGPLRVEARVARVVQAEGRAAELGDQLRVGHRHAGAARRVGRLGRARDVDGGAAHRAAQLVAGADQQVAVRVAGVDAVGVAAARELSHLAARAVDAGRLLLDRTAQLRLRAGALLEARHPGRRCRQAARRARLDRVHRRAALRAARRWSRRRSSPRCACSAGSRRASPPSRTGRCSRSRARSASICARSIDDDAPDRQRSGRAARRRRWPGEAEGKKGGLHESHADLRRAALPGPRLHRREYATERTGRARSNAVRRLSRGDAAPAARRVRRSGSCCDR